MDKGFRGVVRRQRGKGLTGRVGGDVDDVPRPLFNHVRNSSTTRKHRALAIHVDGLSPLVPKSIFSEGEVHDAGAVDDDVDAAAVLDNSFVHTLNFVSTRAITF